jgi:hypothetical protein
MENATYRDVASHTTWPNPNEGSLEEKANPIVFPLIRHSQYQEGGLRTDALAEQYISLEEDTIEENTFQGIVGSNCTPASCA